MRMPGLPRHAVRRLGFLCRKKMLCTKGQLVPPICDGKFRSTAAFTRRSRRSTGRTAGCRLLIESVQVKISILRGNLARTEQPPWEQAGAVVRSRPLSSRIQVRYRRVLALVVSALSLVTLVAVVQGVAKADNPIIQTIYTADPAPLVYNGRVYLYTGHDEDNSSYFTMKEWRGWSSAGMGEWGRHRSRGRLKTFSWGDPDARAGQNGYPQRQSSLEAPRKSPT